MNSNFSHYFKSVAHLQHIDVYRVLQLFEVQHPAIQHAVKKLLVAGGRGVKDQAKDVQEAIVALQRYMSMHLEEQKLATRPDSPRSDAPDERGGVLVSPASDFLAQRPDGPIAGTPQSGRNYQRLEPGNS